MDLRLFISMINKTTDTSKYTVEWHFSNDFETNFGATAAAAAAIADIDGFPFVNLK